MACSKLTEQENNYSSVSTPILQVQMNSAEPHSDEFGLTILQSEKDSNAQWQYFTVIFVVN